MNKKEIIIAKQRQQNLRLRLDKADKVVNELQDKKSKEEAEVIAKAVLLITDETTLMEIAKLVDGYVISSSERKTLGLKNRRKANDQ